MQGSVRTARAFRFVTLATMLAVVLLALPQSGVVAKPATRSTLARLKVAPTLVRKHIRHHARGKFRADRDGDGLPNRYERRRTHTNPRRRDTDGDGLSDWVEVKRTKTNPRRSDTDGDGYSDGKEVAAGSDPLDPTSVPGGQSSPGEGEPEQPPPSPPTPEEPEGEGGEEEQQPEPVNAIWTAPRDAQVGVSVALDGTASTGAAPLSCQWSFENETGSTVYQTKSGCEIEFTFESIGTKYVRLTVNAQNGDSASNRQSFPVGEASQAEPPGEEAPSEEPPAEEPPSGEEPPPPGPSSCTGGATIATSAAQVRSAVQGNDDVCVTTEIGDVDLSGLGARAVVVSTDGGSIGAINLSSTTDLTISGARFRSITLRGSHRAKLLGNTIGGTKANRVYDQLIFMPETNNDVRIEGNDIGWTLADMSGNTGYGCRCYGTLNRLRFVGNKLHDLAGDGFQGVGGSDVLIDRNEIGPVGRSPGSSEHSDNIQITGNGENLRITNNWIHRQGYYEDEITANAGSTYIHGGSTGSLFYENNLVETAQGRTEICGLGTGGTSRSNITIRRNTWVDGGRAFTGFPGFEWDCDSGSGNTVERNIAVDPDGGFAQDGSASAATFSANLFGQESLVALDSAGNCTSANCNPAGQEPIGYRKPSGVSW